MREFFDKVSHQPLAIGIAAAAALLLLSLVILMVVGLRRRRLRRDKELRAELLGLEREEQFNAAVRHLSHQRKVAQISRNIADVFGEFLWSRVLGIYAGHRGDEQAVNLLPENALAGTEFAAFVPRSIAYSMLAQFSWPRLAKLSVITGMTGPAPALPVQQSAQTTAHGDAETRSSRGAEAYKTGPLTTHGEPNSEDVLILPWSGPFEWSGIVVARVKQSANPESLARYNEPLAVLGERLGVALELEQTDARLSQSTERSVSFSRAVLSALDRESPVQLLIKEVASLLGSESAALWRLDEASGMVSMIASHGLKSAEFLPLPVGQGLAGSIIQNGEVLALEDAPGDPRCIFPREARESGIASYLGAPVVDGGKAVAIVEVHASQHHAWTDSDRRLLEAAATVVAELLKSADARGNRLRVETAYLGLSEALQRLRTPDDLMEAAVEVLGHALGVSRALVVELGDNAQVEPVTHEYHAAGVRTAAGANLGNSVVAGVAAAQNGKVAISDSLDASLVSPTTAVELQLRSELAVGIRIEGAIRSIIYLHQCDRTREWQDDEVEFVERVARQLSLSLLSVRAFESLSNEANVAREAARQAAESSGRIQSLINALPESVLVLDSESRLTYFNATARDRLGLSQEDVGRPARLAEVLTFSEGRAWDEVSSGQGPARFEAELSRAAAGASVAQAVATAQQTRLRVSIAVAPFRSTQGGPVVGRIFVVSDVGHLTAPSSGDDAKGAELKQKLASAEASLAQARATAESAQAAAAEADQEVEGARRAEDQAKSERDQMQAEIARAQAAAQQLLETNRLKSDFILSAGHEIEASLQPVLGLTELLSQGQYGTLTPEQQEAIRNVYAWARRIKGDVDWLVEYGSARSRRLEPGGES